MDILLAQSNENAISNIAAFFPFILIGIIFYFLILRPQNQQRKKHDDFLKNIKKGDKIITRGGIHGKIANFTGKDNSIIILDLGNDLKINISRNYIVNKLN